MLSFEDAFFEKKQINWSSLADFGFIKNQTDWVYRESFLDQSFEARIRILPDGQVLGEIIDLDLDEPYLAYQVVSPVGAFVHQVREAYGAILDKVAKACFVPQLFRSDQANRIAQRLMAHYQDEPDHPFKRIPDAVVFRSPANQKWYALFMSVSRNKVDQRNSADSEPVDILNIKVDEQALPDLLNQEGVYPSYHMSKTSWLTIMLDGRLADDVIIEWIGRSRTLVSPKGYQSENGGADYWIVPANLKLYAIDLEFAQSKEHVWSHKGKIKAGDVMGIYITAPTRALRYLCQISEVFAENGKNLMRIHLLKTLPDTTFPIRRLSELGVTTVRGPRRMTPDLVKAVKSVLSDVK